MSRTRSFTLRLRSHSLAASLAGDLADPFHGADQNPHAVAQQARIGRIVDVGLHHGGVHAHSAPSRQPVGLRQLHQPLVNLLDHLGPTAKPQRPIVFASGVLPAPTRVKSRYTRLARTSRSSTS